VADAIAGALARGGGVAGGGGDAKKARKRAARAAAAAAAAAAEALAPRAAAAAEDSDEDIFGDAGREYVPPAPKAAQSDADCGSAPGVVAAPGSYFGGESSARGDAASARRSAARVVPSAGAADSGETDTDDRATRDDGVTGPMPAPPAPDFASAASFEASYAAYVSAGRGGGGAAAASWDAGAASAFLRTCPDFALALTAHSVAAQAAREADAPARSDGADEGKKPTRSSRRAPATAADAAAALERRAEASLAADDGYGECYAGGAIGHAAFYASDDEDDPGAKGAKEGAKEGKQNAKEARRGGNGDAERTRREEETKSRERKLDVELGSLQRLMREKYGDKVDVAFEDKRGEKRAGGEEGGEGGEGEDAARRARGKRVRL
jgi:IK cytokine